MAALVALLMVLAPSAVMAQNIEAVNVPSEGYVGTGTLDSDHGYTIFYNITVPPANVLVYDFEVIGNGSISVFLSKMDDPLNYYRSFSTPVPVREFSKTFPADFGYVQDYFLQVNCSTGYEVSFKVSIHAEEAPTENYTVYYVLLALGFVALVIFSYKFVVWQEKQEKKEKQVRRRKGKKRQK